MKTFSKNWRGSKKPKKQRKYKAKAPLHLKRKFLNAGLSKELRAKHKRRSIELRKGDTVKVLIGKFKKKTAKVLRVKTKLGKIYLEGIQRKKMDGSMVDIPFRAPNLQITELDTNDKKRFKNLKLNMESKKTENSKREGNPEVKKEGKKSKGEKKK